MILIIFRRDSILSVSFKSDFPLYFASKKVVVKVFLIISLIFIWKYSSDYQTASSAQTASVFELVSRRSFSVVHMPNWLICAFFQWLIRSKYLCDADFFCSFLTFL